MVFGGGVSVIRIVIVVGWLSSGGGCMVEIVVIMRWW